jgi:hypothetical protein
MFKGPRRGRTRLMSSVGGLDWEMVCGAAERRGGWEGWSWIGAGLELGWSRVVD